MPSENIFRRHYKICSPFQMSNVHPYTIFATMLDKSTAKDILIMSYDLSKRLVIGLASSALFDLSESDNIFRTEGAETYRQYQREKQNHPLKKGVAFPFIKKLLSINEINPNDPPIEVILLSRNDPDTGLRVMNSIEAYGLDITRALFLQGGDPHRYIKTLSIDLFLSANEVDVRQAITAGYPAGHVLASHFEDGCLSDSELRIALDFDGVLIDDSSEKIYADQGIRSFQEYELKHSNKTHNSGPLTGFLKKLSEIQIQEKDFSVTNRQYKPKLRIAIITARQNLHSYNMCDNKAAYVIKKCNNFDISLLASGSEVSLAYELANDLINKNIKAQVISVPILQDLVNDENLIKSLNLDKKPMFVIEAANDYM